VRRLSLDFNLTKQISNRKWCHFWNYLSKVNFHRDFELHLLWSCFVTKGTGFAGILSSSTCTSWSWDAMRCAFSELIETSVGIHFFKSNKVFAFMIKWRYHNFLDRFVALVRYWTVTFLQLDSHLAIIPLLVWFNQLKSTISVILLSSNLFYADQFRDDFAQMRSAEPLLILSKPMHHQQMPG